MSMRGHPCRETALTSHLKVRLRVSSTRGLGQWGVVIVTVLALLGSWPAAQAATSAVPSVTVAPSLPSRQPVGTAITWTARSAGMQNPVYRFSVRSPHGPSRVVRDFSPTPSFTWTPLHEGTYAIRATAKDGFGVTSTSDTVAVATFTVTSRITGQNAVVSALSNPVVALYSAPACASGTVAVRFRAATGVTWHSTAPQPCRTRQSINVIVAGMRAHTRYVLQHVVSDGAHHTTSSPLTFTTGTPPAALKIATFTVKKPAAPQADLGMRLIFHALAPIPSPTLANPIATDLHGQLLWYYDTLRSGLTMIWPLNILAGGTVLLFGRDRYRTTGDDVLREVDLAGDTVRETNIDAVNAQLARRGQEAIYAFHHDAVRLPNGDTAVIGETQQKVGGHDVMGDMVLVLDPNFQVTWTWNIFGHLTPGPSYPMDQTCRFTYPKTLCALPDQRAVDWTHANGLGWSRQDGDLTLSSRQLDWVIKIDYRNGHGTGNVVWRLGKGGDFTLKSADPSAWFSYQHNAHFVDARTLVLFDNSYLRCRLDVKGCHSRGQEWKLNEQDHVATPLLNVDLGSFRPAAGSAQKLANGNLFFAGGIPASSAIEFRPDGSIVYELDTAEAEYRDYRLGALSY